VKQNAREGKGEEEKRRQRGIEVEKIEDYDGFSFE